MRVNVQRAGYVAAAVTAAVLLGACGAVGGLPSMSASSNVQGPQQMFGAPHVANPLHSEKFVKAPCSLITRRQFEPIQSKYSLGTKAAPDNVPTALGVCKYTPANVGSGAAVGSVGLLRGGAGLAGVYASRDGDAVFEPVTIAGYPAVNQLVRGEEDSGTCGITVGLADNQALSADFTAGDLNAPRTQTCGAATAMANAAVETIKANQ